MKVKSTTNPVALRLDGKANDQLSYIRAAMNDRFGDAPSNSTIIRRAIDLLSQRVDGMVQANREDELENELYFLRSAASGTYSPWVNAHGFDGMTTKPYRQLVSEKLRMDFDQLLSGDD